MTWQQVLRTNFTRWSVLADFWQLSDAQRQSILPDPRFILNLPHRLANKAAKSTLDDPIVRQFLPLSQEAQKTPQFVDDPVADATFQCAPRLLKKYKGRALLMTTGACAMHCRYCFRQNYDYNQPDKLFDEEIAYIAQESDIHEVILSGGDPLSLPNQTLENLLEQLTAIPHVRKIRFHSRFPIGIPERIDEGFLNLLAKLPKQVWFIIHSNHVNEFDSTVWDALQNIRRTGAVLLNQSVLLKGVNDTFEDLHALCTALSDHGIVPYYLHQLDRVQGAAHFEVPEAQGLQLIAQLEASLPGYAVPRYVREIAGAPSKTRLH